MNGTCEPPSGCNVNGDCTNPATPVCDPNTHTCVAAMPEAGPPDSGMVADGGVDAPAGDSGTTVDSSVIEDAPTEDGTVADGGVRRSDSGYVQGGGGCAVAAAEAPASTAAGWLLGIGLAFGARRRARRKSWSRARTGPQSSSCGACRTPLP